MRGRIGVHEVGGQSCGEPARLKRSDLAREIVMPHQRVPMPPVIHDTRAGLRINARCQVVDMSGTVIAGLYCGGESAGGFSMHGLARCMCQGYIAVAHAAAESGTT